MYYLRIISKHAAARAAAEPHWQRAEAERAAALALGKPIRQAEQALAAASANLGNNAHTNADTGAKPALQAQLRALKQDQQARDSAARAAQSEGDALFWPVFNLDIKNPHAKAGLEHAEPKDLVASMRVHEDAVMRLLGEIEALVAEVAP